MDAKKSPGPKCALSPANKPTVGKGPLDRFLFRGKASIAEKSSKPSQPDPEVLVPDTTDCIDLVSDASSNQSKPGKVTSDLKQQVIEETMAEADASNEDDDEEQIRTSFTVSDSSDNEMSGGGKENSGKSGRISQASGKRSASGAQIGTPGSAKAQKKRRRLSLEEKKAREAEIERKKAEREEKRIEKERQKAELEQAKRDRAEARKKKIEASKQAQQEREEKRKQEKKQAELEKEEKRLAAEREREEKRKQKEVEKQLNEDAKKRKLEEEQAKKSKAAELFKRHFFVVQGNKGKQTTDEELADTSYKSFGPWKMFQLRPNQRLAPICRISKNDRDQAKTQLNEVFGDDVVAVDTKPSRLLDEYKSGRRQFRTSSPTFLKPEVDVIQLDENHNNSVMRAKLLQFNEDIRPPYFGTWRKKSKVVTARKPFAQDTGMLDYECDSADEWEEPEEGEDIVSSSKESGDEDGEGKSDDEEEDGFIVPHGYLSSDEEEQAREEEENLVLPPSDMKTRNRIQDTYELGFKRLARSLRPIFFGPDLVDSGRPTPVDLSQYQAIFYEPVPADFEALLCGEVVVPDPDAPKEPSGDKANGTGDSSVPQEGVSSKKTKISKDAENVASPGQPKYVKRPVPEDGYPALIRYVHGNTVGINRLIEGFVESFAKEPVVGCDVSKRQVERQIFSIAERTVKAERHPTVCWYVRDDVLSKYELADLPVPNPNQSTPKKPAPRTKKTESSGAVAMPKTPTPAVQATQAPCSQKTPKPIVAMFQSANGQTGKGD